MKLCEIPNPTGSWNFVVSGLILLVNHGMRDHLITALPSAVACPSNNTSYEDLLQAEFRRFIQTFLWIQRRTLEDGNNTNGDEECEQFREGWTSPLIGGTLSSIHWGWLIALIVTPFIIKRVSVRWLICCSLITSGLLSLLNQLVYAADPFGLLIIRIVQGALQGCCYPAVYYLLEGEVTTAFKLPYFLIFLAPWLGSALGVLMGLVSNPFAGAYGFGVLSILIGTLSVFISLRKPSLDNKPKHVWRECLSSSAVWACILLQMSMTWAIHLFLVGLTFTLKFKLNREDLIWTVFVIIIVTGVVTRLVAMVAMSLLRTHLLSPLNRRRCIIVISSAVIVIALVTDGVSGIEGEFVALGMTTIGVGIGAAIGLVGVRLNFHDLGPMFPTPFLILGSIGATVGAGAASLLFPVMSQVDVEKNGAWQIAWITPIVVVLIVCFVHLFLVSVIPLSHQTLITTSSPTSPALSNGGVPSTEIDERSYKTTKSAFSFKTAVSRPRTRTASFKTVDDNNEADLQTIPGSEVDDYMSAAHVEEDTEDMKSVVSCVTAATSYKSVGGEAKPKTSNGVDYGIVLSAQDLDRTTAWLTTHHSSTGLKIERQTSSEKLMIEKNLLLALQW